MRTIMQGSLIGQHSKKCRKKSRTEAILRVQATATAKQIERPDVLVQGTLCQVKYNAASVAEITAKLKHAKARSFGVAQDRLNTPLNVSHVPSNRRRLTSTQGQYCK